MMEGQKFFTLNVSYLLNQSLLNVVKQYIVYCWFQQATNNIFTKYMIAVTVGTLNQDVTLLIFSDAQVEVTWF